MIDGIIYLILIWAIYQVYKHLFGASKTEACQKCAKNLK